MIDPHLPTFYQEKVRDIGTSISRYIEAMCPRGTLATLQLTESGWALTHEMIHLYISAPETLFLKKQWITF